MIYSYLFSQDKSISTCGKLRKKTLKRRFEVFIAPCVFYILTIINQYDDRLQAKQRATKMEKARRVVLGWGWGMNATIEHGDIIGI